MHKLLYNVQLLVLVSFILLGCNDKTKETKYPKYDKHGKLIVYNEETYAKMWIKNRNLDVTVVDTFCINQKKRAINDIKKGKLIHFGFYNHLIDKKIIKMLTKHNISFKKHLGRCVRMGVFEPYCYQEEMWKAINRKYGENFIDSLVEITKKEYILEHPNVAYMEHGLDLRDKYLPHR